MNKPLKEKKGKFFNIPLFPDLFLILSAIGLFIWQGAILLNY